MFSGGMGFSILGVLVFDVCACCFDMMKLGGMSKHTELEFGLSLSNVLDMSVGELGWFC
jgi:hypothetical protein